MLEPSNPVTLKTRYTPYPAVELQSDEGRALRPGSIILRHRHLKQQFTIVPSASRRRPPTLAPPQCNYQLAPTSTVAAVAPAANPVVARRVGATPGLAIAPGPASVAPPPPVATPPALVAAEIPRGVSAGKGNGVPPVQPLPVEAAHRNTSRGHEIVETGDSNLVVRRAQRAIRDKKGQTTWFYSNGQTYLLEPPLLESTQLGDLYVHTTANRDQQIWMFNRNSLWEKISLYHPHPVLSGYVLHRVSDGEPRWIQKTTLTTYRGREKRYRQMCSQREAEAAPPMASSGQATRHSDAP